MQKTVPVSFLNFRSNAYKYTIGYVCNHCPMDGEQNIIGEFPLPLAKIVGKVSYWMLS